MSSRINHRKLVFFLLLAQLSRAFVTINVVRPSPTCRPTSDVTRRSRTSTNDRLYVIPLSKFSDSMSFLSKEVGDEYRCCIDSNGRFWNNDDDRYYELGIVEEQDLPQLCKFVVATFGADAISLSTNMNNLERMLLNPAAEFLNGYSNLVAFAEVYSGTRQRILDRIQHNNNILPPSLDGLSPQEKITKAERDSLILILSRPNADASNQELDIIATIELRLQPCDAKIPFSIPWLDRVERRMGTMIGLGADRGASDLQPYLSNLCVSDKYRGQKIGRALVRCVENITRTCWKYNRIYLHVDEDNIAALKLYQSEGYRDVGHRWNPFWSGRAADIGYFVKTLT
ncbi:acetyltransferase GNAT domain containing protein [Nitzschia inconspicua]|uniref:Acetyltransferase GNAT domain containing protein n=1 Tax=Nitzschia inconspicua TaxID=303405 RepID=A0A9K3LQ84_9STRA|nr:acetyltransferase GNAT domain containing protein [Nitzschia inconspicua]